MIDLPEQYIIQSFYEYGFNPHHNRYNNTYQCGCPICLEGKSLKTKKRCYFIPENNNIFCHNCGYSSKPVNWIKRISGKTTLEIIQEVKEYDNAFVVPKKDAVKKRTPTASLPEDCINLFDSQQLEYWKDNDVVKKCISFIKSRKLDVAANRPDNMYVSLSDTTHKNRLVIPFVDDAGIIQFYQSRTILKEDEKDNPKYKSKTNADRSLFNLDKVEPGETVYAFEGPFDAYFVKNGIAIAGITEKGDHILTDVQTKQKNRALKFSDIVWCFDSQWLDKAAYINTKKLLQRGESVFIWPQSIGTRFKDMNDLICASSKVEVSREFIQKNTYKGIVGELKLSEVDKWKELIS
jgi:hypothetical protein